MDVLEIVTKGRDSLGIKRIFGEPYEKNGMTFIPAAHVAGGYGGGTGTDEHGQEGQGGGFGMVGRPAGAYVIKGADVRWQPAIDVNRLLTMIGLVAISYLLFRRRRR